MIKATKCSLLTLQNSLPSNDHLLTSVTQLSHCEVNSELKTIILSVYMSNAFLFLTMKM